MILEFYNIANLDKYFGGLAQTFKPIPPRMFDYRVPPLGRWCYPVVKCFKAT